MPKSSAFHSTATSRALGTASLRSAKRLADSSVATSETPVMLPPGWARLATRPVATGSPEKVTTIAVSPARCFAANAAGSPLEQDVLVGDVTALGKGVDRRGAQEAYIGGPGANQPDAIDFACLRQRSALQRHERGDQDDDYSEKSHAICLVVVPR